jgi:signal transduction histidine kinase
VNGRFEKVALPGNMESYYDVQAIAVDADDGLWVSIVRNGIFRRADGQWSRPTSLPGGGKEPAFVMHEDASGQMWLGYAENRIVAWRDGKARQYSAADGLDVGNVMTIQEKGAHFWAAGERGLSLLEADRFRSLTLAEPQTARGIVGLVETDEGDLWMEGSSGTVRVPAAELRNALADPRYRMVHRVYDEDDGIVGAPVTLRPLPALIAGTDGRIWIATTEGATWVDPARLAVNTVPPTVTIKAIVANRVRQALPQPIALRAHTSNLQIDYTATSLAMPQRARFRYRMEGVDRDWQDAGSRRQAFYTNLDPGTYRFQVIAANEDGLWNREGASLSFTIAPAFYQTRWFIALCALASLLALGLLYRMRLRQIGGRIQGRLEERLVERERIARELHDTLMQGFQGLILKFQGAMQHIPTQLPAREMMEQALKRADAVLAEGRDRVRDLRESVGVRGDLPTALAAAAEELSHVRAAEFELRVHGEPRPMHPVVMDEAYRIGREALSNAYFHSEAKRIEVELDYSKGPFLLRVRDDGKGIEASVLKAGGVPGHWGLAGMQERAKRLGGKLIVRSGPGSGAEVELEVPARTAYEYRRNS